MMKLQEVILGKQYIKRRIIKEEDWNVFDGVPGLTDKFLGTGEQQKIGETVTITIQAPWDVAI